MPLVQRRRLPGVGPVRRRHRGGRRRFYGVPPAAAGGRGVLDPRVAAGGHVCGLLGLFWVGPPQAEQDEARLNGHAADVCSLPPLQVCRARLAVAEVICIISRLPQPSLRPPAAWPACTYP